MSVSLVQAAQAYRNAPKAGAAMPGEEAAAEDFASMLKNSLNTAIGQGKTAEQLSVAAAAGKADLTGVLTAVAEAEVTVQTVVAVRDKMIEAYREIIRMPI
ncbi:MAG: flagellar hook-basal body complex protein FliE [Magnetospiraceae bacterium]